MKRLRIVKYPWHTGHDYELAKLPHDFCFLGSTPRRWATEHRPIPKSIQWISSVSESPSDLMILHLDQWSYQEPAKRFLFESHRNRYQGKKVIILHGSCTTDGMTPEQLRSLIGDIPTVCNSKNALATWKIPQLRYIRHGMSVEEWPATDYSLQNVVVVQAFQSRHKRVRNVAGVTSAQKQVPITWIGRDLSFRSFVEYRHFLSRSSIFFNPSFDSANPRSRTEAMLCGLAVVTTNANGEDEYIENGINGFCSNDLDELISFLEELHSHPQLAQKIGRRGRETARELFHIEQFQNQWSELLSEVCGEAK